MGILNKTWIALTVVAIVLAGCGGGVLVTLPSELVEVQREANLTRDSLSGTWKGILVSEDGQTQETIYLLFTQPNDISLSGSRLVRQRIGLAGKISQDTFALANGVFQKPEVKFNLSSGGSLVVLQGSPVLYQGLLSENTYISGTVVSGDIPVGHWEIRQ